MDYLNMQRDLLVHIRHPLSQEALSQKLGYRFNKCYRWEAGRTRLTWPEFAKICKLCRVSLSRCLKEVHYYKQPASRHDLLVKHLLGVLSDTQASRIAKISHHRLQRWKYNKAVPALAEILQLMDTLSRSADAFIAALCGEPVAGEPQAAVENPYCAIADILFLLPEYQQLKRHRRGHIAKQLGISVKEEEELLLTMEKYGLLRKVGGKFAPTKKGYSTRPLEFREHARVITFWLQKAISALNLQQRHGWDEEKSMAGYLVLYASDDSMEKIKQRMREFYDEIGNIVRSDDKPLNSLRVLQVQIFDPLMR